MSIASICLSLTKMAARFVPTPDVNTVLERGVPPVLHPILYGPFIQITSLFFLLLFLGGLQWLAWSAAGLFAYITVAS